jgi:transposase-like protein
MSDSGKGDAEKARYWQRTISEAVQSGISIRQFCRQRRLKESQFYRWQHKLRSRRQAGTTSKSGDHGRRSKYPPAKPGALVCEPLKAAGRGR